MRLLSTDTTETLQLRQYSSDISKYAILSHTWEENEEVAFEELGTLAAKEKRGFQKIKQFCRRAAKDGYEYVWVDTCCIDKRSSSELSEALNSMYEWYKNADMCYAYLRDVNDRDPTHRESQLTASKWFTRGWTLQELVAPEHVHFFGEDAEGWFPIGTKVGLQQVISRITKIDACVLQRSEDVFKASIAQRMSWASGRKTTRKEDIAYCLLGIFNVNMPLLYGEGDKAFTRLQLELLNVPNDHTLFAW
ncbi:HET-domain-containing protein, partial [Hyaloscypha variabilis F]